jgi:hypothetical protein
MSGAVICLGKNTHNHEGAIKKNCASNEQANDFFSYKKPCGD